jgi:hypothetical protein
MASTVGLMMAPTPGIPSTLVEELIEVWFDRGECLNDSLPGIWRQLVE